MAFKKFKENIVHYAIYLTIGFILLSTVLSFWNRYVTYDTRAIVDEMDIIHDLVKAINTEVIVPIEANVKTYAITKEQDRMLPLVSIRHRKDSIFQMLKSMLVKYEIPVKALESLSSSIDNYIKEAGRVMVIIQNNELEIPSEVKAFSFTDDKLYRQVTDEIDKFTIEIRDHAQSDYEWSIADNAIIQIILILLSIPILIIASKRLAREILNNQQLLQALDTSNRQYLFDDKQTPSLNSKSVVEKSIASLRRAFDFVHHISLAEYKTARTLLPQNLMADNQNTLMGALVDMSLKLEKNEDADRQRQWIAEGLNQFYEIVRINQHDFNSLGDNIVMFLVKYLKSQQGALFIVKDDHGARFMELTAAYAFERKKWLEKRIDLGEGLLSQAYLEGEPILMTDIPENYLHITSGLGMAMPTCLIIAPFIYNGKTEAVFEVASFSKYESYQLEFLKRAGEFIAGTLQNVNKNMQMQQLLAQSQEQAETLRAQEEELRQNMEELAATNEAMKRREQELELVARKNNIDE